MCLICNLGIGKVGPDGRYICSGDINYWGGYMGDAKGVNIR